MSTIHGIGAVRAHLGKLPAPETMTIAERRQQYDRAEKVFALPPEMAVESVQAGGRPAEWLRTRRIEVTLSDAARRVITGPVGDAPLDHVAFAAEDVAAVERTLRTAGVEPVRRTTASVFYRAADETVEITAETDRPDAFWCPMHPNVRAPGATKCPICAMDLVPIAPPRAGEYSAAARTSSLSSRRPARASTGSTWTRSQRQRDAAPPD